MNNWGLPVVQTEIHEDEGEDEEMLRNYCYNIQGMGL